MRGYEKGTDVPAELATLRAAFAKVAAAIWATYDNDQAWRWAGELGETVKQLYSDAATLRARVAAEVARTEGLTIEGTGRRLGISMSRAGQLVKTGRKETIMTESADMPELPAVALAIITDGGLVLVERRRDGIPPVTFPGGEVLAGESAGEAAARRVLAETGLTVISSTPIGRRIHPKTQRTMIYLAAETDLAEPRLLDTEDLLSVEWMAIEETRRTMPDMFAPVREYLDAAEAATPPT
jgi:8-oxo-dGTP diphosphatase